MERTGERVLLNSRGGDFFCYCGFHAEDLFRDCGAALAFPTSAHKCTDIEPGLLESTNSVALDMHANWRGRKWRIMLWQRVAHGRRPWKRIRIELIPATCPMLCSMGELSALAWASSPWCMQDMVSLDKQPVE